MKVHVAILLALLAVCLSAGADYRRSYLDGVKALERGALDEAVRRLSEAIAERPQEQVRARLVGAIPEPYLPHHYLGLALARSGRCREALTAWRRSDEQGAIAAYPARQAEIAELRRRCEGSEGGVQTAPRPSGESDPAGPAPTPTVSEAPPPTAVTPSPVSAPADEPVVREAAPPPAAAPTPLEAPPAPALPRDEGASSPALVEAVQAYCRGDYADALAGLVRMGEPDGPERFYVAFYRGASRFALWALAGEQQAELLEAARADLRLARRLRPGFLPPLDYFSPRLARFFADPEGPTP
jgi:hypothetical protein